MLIPITAAAQRAFHKVFIVVTPGFSSHSHRSLRAAVFLLREPRVHPSRPARNS
ncbi:hypothetical protein RHECNPAF_7300107 [Rhizobium etli CNPAF512]|nr:hypothetical protein RHECNPAF_7300107 [Rhizobium etli CNPAF512]